MTPRMSPSHRPTAARSLILPACPASFFRRSRDPAVVAAGMCGDAMMFFFVAVERRMEKTLSID